MRITLQMVKDLDPCECQLEDFEKFLAGRKYVLVTERNIDIAYNEKGIDIIWAMQRGLFNLEALKVLARSEISNIRVSVLQSKECSKELVNYLATDSDAWVRGYAASDERISYTNLEILSKDEFHSVKEAVAKNHKTPQEILCSLAEDEDSVVREAVIKNHRTPVSTLMMLAGDEDLWVKRELCRTRYDGDGKPLTMNENVIWILVNDESWRVRMRVVNCTSVTQRALMLLRNDKNVDVRYEARARLKLPHPGADLHVKLKG